MYRNNCVVVFSYTYPEECSLVEGHGRLRYQTIFVRTRIKIIRSRLKYNSNSNCNTYFISRITAL
jgi:hypothetical protein